MIFSLAFENLIDHVLVDTIEIDDSLNNRNTCHFTIRKRLEDDFVPKVGMEVQIDLKVCDEWVRAFGGTIDRISGKSEFEGATIFFRCECVDFNQLADRRLVFKIYENQAAGDIIKDIVEVFMQEDEIDTSGVKSTIDDAQHITITKAVFSYKKASSCFDELSKLTGLHWHIDYFKVLHFFPRSQEFSDFSIRQDRGDTLGEFCAWLKDYKDRCVKGVKYGDVGVTWQREQVTNEQFVIAGNDTTDLRQDDFTGDGTRTTFTLEYIIGVPKLNDDGDIADDAIQVNVGGGGLANQTLAVRDSGVTAQWYYQKGEKEIIQDKGETPLTSSDFLEVNYKGLYPIVIRERDDKSIDDRSNIEGGSGIYAQVHDDESIESESYAQQLANGLLRRYAKIPVIVDFTTDSAILKSGEMMDVVLQEFGVVGIKNDRPVSTAFMIDSVNITDLGSKVWRFKATLLSGEHLGSWQEFYKKLELFGRQLKLREQQTLVITSNSPEENLLEKEEFVVEDGDETEFSWTPTGSPLEPTDDMSTEVCAVVGFAIVGKTKICYPEAFELGLQEN